MKKILKLLSISIILLSCGCNKQQVNEPSTSNFISEIKKTKSGKTYYSLDGKPVTPIGIQIRTDLLIYKENKSFDEIKTYFQCAKNLGVSLVEIPLPWRESEPSKDMYNFRDVGKILSIANELELKVEFLLFSTNTTGWSDNVPDYIKEDSLTYPRYKSLKSPNGLFLVQNNAKLLEREGKWLNELMSAINTWSISNNNTHVVSAIQIHNESDTFPRFVLSQQEIMTVDGSRRLTDIEAWQETLDAYDYLGKVVKKSDYKCITRVNVAQAYKDSWQNFVQKIYSLEGIDIVGDDTYEQTVSFNKSVIKDFNSQEIFNGNNFPHISENDGSYNTTPSLILGCLAMGGGYMIYDLATPEIAVNEYGWDDWSIVDNVTLQDKSHTSLSRKIINGITLAGSDFILEDIENIASFNIRNNIPSEQITQTMQTNRALVTFEANNASMGYLITGDKYIDIYLTDDATISIQGANYQPFLYTGYVNNDGSFIQKEKLNITDSKLSLKGDKLYRLNIDNYESNFKSNTIDFIGGI